MASGLVGSRLDFPVPRMMTLITILLVRVIEAGKSVVEARRGIPRRYSWPAAGRGVPTTAWQPARVEGGHRSFPVDTGHSGAVADAGAGDDESVGEVLAP